MSIKDPDAVIAIVSALQHAHGDDTARVLAEGVTLAAIIQAVLAGPMSNRDAVRTVARSLADFAISPDLGPMWHVRYVYERPGSFNVADMEIRTPTGTVASVKVTLRLPI
jgi:hypothetical protein